MSVPTQEAYAELQAAFDHFNHALFDDELPPCLITLQRERSIMGHYFQGRFVQTATGEMVDEIAMNPGYFASFPIEITLSTLVHEMCHQWQYHHGKPSRAGYHNREWADKMEAIGLMPSTTGQPGGKRTGQQMDDYIIEAGPFAQACLSLLTRDYCLSWVDRFAMPGGNKPGLSPGTAPGATEESQDGNTPESLEAPPAPVAGPGSQWTTPKPAMVNRSNRAKYRCPVCEAQVWGKPGLSILCGQPDCSVSPMLPAP